MSLTAADEREYSLGTPTWSLSTVLVVTHKIVTPVNNHDASTLSIMAASSLNVLLDTKFVAF
jgi:hypothetical protein